MANLPKYIDELDDEAMEIAWQGYNPCDGCARIHYSDETPCEFPDGDERPGDQPQHCGCWYDCEPCEKCGDDPVVIYGPPLSFLGWGDRQGSDQ